MDGLLIPLLPPSFGRRWRVAPEVGFALFFLRPTPCPSGISLPREGGRWVTHPASPSFLWKEVARSAGGWLRSLSSSANPLPFGHLPPTGRGKMVFHHFSLLPLEGGGAQRRRLASLSFSFGQPPALRASPFHGKGVDGLLIPFLPPSFGRRWRAAPEVGFALFRLRPTPCPSGIPFHWKGHSIK